MTPRTPQCEVFFPLLLSSKHSGVPEDSKSQLFQVLGFAPTLGQSGVATDMVIRYYNKDLIRALVAKVLEVFHHLELGQVYMKR
jgi:hypothetical protein